MSDTELAALVVLAREEFAQLELATARINAAVAKYGECPFDPDEPCRWPRPATERLREELIERGVLSP